MMPLADKASTIDWSNCTHSTIRRVLSWRG